MDTLWTVMSLYGKKKRKKIRIVMCIREDKKQTNKRIMPL